MFVILTYDVSARRTKKVLKTCRRYLSHVQKSVFEGVITSGKLDQLKRELRKQIVVKEDSIHIYKFESLRFAEMERIDVNPLNDHIL